MTSMSRKALGKGLSALLRDREGTTESELCELDIDLLEPNRFQPRQTFSEAKLEELAQSIKTHGLVQPIIARQNGDRYQIIAGERRWRPAQRLGLLKVPVMIKQVADEELLETSLIENIQRENLNPIEEAKAYQRLGHEFSLTQDQVAQRTSKERSTITNFIRLLKLPKEIQQLILDDQLSMGHRGLRGAGLCGLPPNSESWRSEPYGMAGLFGKLKGPSRFKKMGPPRKRPKDELTRT